MKKNTYIQWLAAGVLFLTACTTDTIEEESGSGNRQIVLSLSPEESSVKTKATEAGDPALNENSIKTINVFFFSQNAPDTESCMHSESFNGLSFSGTGVFTQALTVSTANFLSGVTYDVYTIVNLPADVTVSGSVTLGALKALHTQTPINASVTQSAIMMDGKTSVVVNPVALTPIVNIPISLKRAAAKIRVTFNFGSGSPVAVATSASVTLKNHATKSSLLDGYPYASSGADYANSSVLTGVPTTSTFTFYAYENNWSTQPANETYLLVNIPYGTHASNYYRVPVNRYADTNSDGQNPSATNISGRIQRNRIYDVTVNINGGGSDTETGAVVVNGNYIITDWTTYQIILKTISQHYLGISDYAISMANISTYTLSFVADLPVSVTGVTATCTQYNTDGTMTPIIITSGQAQFPTFTVNQATSKITINSAIPINYVPKYMTFTVTNNLGLSQSATIVQYPARYVTARFSTGNVKPIWTPDVNQNNYNLFTVNTLVPSSNNSYTLGDPTNGYTKTDSLVDGNKMVSPRFIIASQYGIYTISQYTVAQTRCAEYGEDIYRSGWRMPTKSEIELMNTIQDDPNSAVKKLLAGPAYWSAFKFDSYDFTNNVWSSIGATGTAYIRCVYDVYKDEQ